MRSVNKILLLLLIAVPLAGFSGGLKADAIDDYINAEMARQQVPGLALAVLRHGRLERVDGYGFANLEHHVPVHPETVFKSGALGKQFTAVAVMLLVEEGKVELDESIRTYLPEAPQSWASITVRQLLNHTSGLPSFPSGEFRVDYTDEELLGIIYGQPLSYPPGSRWGYSYTGYVVLGMLITRVSGEFYADLLDRRVFTPLGMQTARLIDERAIVPNRAAGYEPRDGELRHPDWVSPTANSTADGSLYLSVLDYARWEAGLIDRELLMDKSWAEIRRPAPLASGSTYPYGFGWFLGKHAGQNVWHHAGEWQGFKTAVVRYLGDELTVVALANGHGGKPAQIVRHVAGMLDPELALPPGAPLDETAPRVTAQLERLLRQIAAGEAEYGDFVFVARPDFEYLMEMHREMLAPLGPLQEVALFARKQLGDEPVYHYRVRYEGGLMEVNLVYASSGKIADLTFMPVYDWNAPVLE